MTLGALSDYGKPFQTKVLGALLSDRKFLQDVQDIIKETYFSSAAHQWIVREVLKYYKEYRTYPTMEVLQIEFKKIDNDVLKVAVREELKHSYESSQDDLDYVKEEFTNFCRNQEMKTAILESADLLKANNYEGIRTRIEKALKAGQDKNVGHNYKQDVETRYRNDYRPTIQTPWEPINVLFSGGLGPGDLFLIVGGPGTGKSWLSIAIAANAVQLGYNVIYYTLELGEDYVARRFDSYLTGYSVDELKSKRSEVDSLMEQLPGNLIIKEYPPRTATISALEAHIQKCTDEGCKPHLIVIDYLDYLKSGSGMRSSERKDQIDDVYVGGKTLAKVLGVPVISPSQVNRMGAREQVIEGDRIAGSYDKLMVADGVLSLSRGREDKVLGTGRIHVMKNRYGADGQTFGIRMNTNNGHVEFDEVGGADPETGEIPAASNSFSREVIANFFKKDNK